MKPLSEVEQRTDVIRLRVLEIFREFKEFSDDPQKVVNLADELEALLSEYDMISAHIAYIHEMTEQLAQETCSGPH